MVARVSVRYEYVEDAGSQLTVAVVDLAGGGQSACRLLAPAGSHAPGPLSY
jgi:hypothetical protein